MNGVKQKTINVFTVLDANPLRFTVYVETLAEDIVVLCCQSLNIGPVARHLFALRFHNRKEFVSPGVRLLESDKNDFEFRLRYKIPSFHKMSTFKRLEYIDPRAHYYYFNQVRTDIMDNKIPDISYDKNRDDLVGLGVVDMYRVMLEQGVSRETVESDYKKYIPKEVRKHHYFFVKKPVHNSLTSISGSNIRNVKDVLNAYLQKFEDMAPNYLTEECEAIMDDAGTVRAVIMKVDPYHNEFPGVAFCYEGKSEWNHLCSIEDLCYISVSDDRTTEISRKTGIPVYLRFSSILLMASFISLLDGYYRLSVKWTFNLCKNLPTPSLQRLYAMKCHGPVGGEFSYAKLEEKRNNQPGCYILRESETAYDVFYLDVCTNQSPKPSTFKITKKSDKCFEFSEDNKSYESIKQLVIALSAPDSPVQLLECLPPSEYDQSPLLLCKMDDSGLNGINSFINGMMPVVTGAPMCIDTRNLQVYKARKKEDSNDLMMTYRGVWRYQKNKKIDVAINVLKTKERETHLPDLLELAGKWAFLDSAAVVKLYGITLMSPVSIVTEYFPLGSLDVYLHEHKNSIEGVDLVEAATYLATAVWHLEEAGIVHGNIRLSKLQVASHTDNSFSVRLCDPGLHTSYTSKDIHWIPVEWQSFGDIEGARRSISADMWAVGTTLWELFSYGEPPDAHVYGNPVKFYGEGGRLPKPNACSSDVYDLMSSCWNADPYRRKKPQEAMRDINQILYQVFNSRRAHAYSTVVNNNVNRMKSNKFGSGSTIGDLSSIFSIDQDNYSKNFNWMGTGGGLVDSGTSLLHQDSSSQSDLMSQSMSVGIPNFDLHTATTSLDSVTSLQGIIELDEYNIILKGKIGQGFYGEVYKGSMEQLIPIDGDAEPQLVAVKKLKSDSITRNSLEDFHREISIMEKLKHPNIVEVKGVILEPEISLVMEYVQHGSLLCYLKIHREKLDPYTHLLKFAYDVALGMEYLGQENIVHRDLAARNILVASDNHVKISDFGLAQVMNTNDYYFSRTNRELPVKWYAPESLENLKFSTRSDVWSYGVTLFEMFSYGEDPCLTELKNCQEIDTIKLLTALKNGARLPCPSTCPVEIYATLISQCWKYDSHLRISFFEALNQIKRILNNNCHYMHVST